MTLPGNSKFVIPAAVGCVLVGGLAWRVLGSEPTQANVGIEPIVPSVSMERTSRPVPKRSVDLVSVGPMETLQERQARAAQEKTVPGAAESASQEGPSKTNSGSMELLIQIPTKDQTDGVPVRIVLDQPKGRSAPTDWTTEAELLAGEDTMLLEDLPPATTFRLQVFMGDERYSSTIVQSNSGSRTTVELDFETHEKQENAAISALRSIAAAQQQLQASAAIDTDADGGGEHGYFAELAGTQPIRSFAPGGATVDPNGVKLDPTYLPASMGELEPASQGGAMIREGYAFMIHLPDDSTSRPILGLAESAHGGNTTRLPGSSNAEIMWCCYAWPVTRTTPMKRAFMINQSGDVIATGNEGASPYVGLNSAPPFDAAFSVPGDMGSEPALTTVGLLSTDRNAWYPVSN